VRVYHETKSLTVVVSHSFQDIKKSWTDFIPMKLVSVENEIQERTLRDNQVFHSFIHPCIYTCEVSLENGIRERTLRDNQVFHLFINQCIYTCEMTLGGGATYKDAVVQPK
jgi:hypothetical protein